MARTRVVFAIGAMHGGGSERQMLTLLRGLDRQKFEPYLYLVYRSGPLLSEVPDDVSISAFEERSLTGGIYLPGRDYRKRIADFAAYVKEVNADVVYDRTFLMTLISAAGAQQAEVPNIATIVTDPSSGFAPVAGRFQWWKKRLLSKLYSRSSLVLANSKGSAVSAERFYGLSADSVVVHYNGVDLEDIRRQAAEPITDSWWEEADSECIRLVTAGRLNHEKGFHLLIDSMVGISKQFSDRRFQLAILGEGSHQDKLNRQIQSSGIADCIKLVGFQTNAAAWYQSADLFVLPSLLEGMPNVLLEAMAVGTPVLSTDCPSGPDEILKGGQYGTLVDVGSRKALAQGIAEFVGQMGQPSLKFRTQKAKQRVETDFLQKECLRQFEALILQAKHDGR